MLFHHSPLISLKYPIRIQYIIPVFYHEIINTVNDSDDGPPKVMNIAYMALFHFTYAGLDCAS